MATGLGSDFHCVTDLDQNLSVVTEKLALAQSMARRLQTPPAHLFYDRNYGEDVTNEIGRTRSPLALQQRAEIEMLKDERVDDVNTKVTRIDPGTTGASDDTIGNLTIDVEIFPSDREPFALTLDVSDGELSLTILEENT